MDSLRDTVKQLLKDTHIPVSVISRESGVPDKTLYYFISKGADMRSDYMQKVYEFLTGKSLLTDEHED